jgi:hypothetical protein
LEISQHYFKPVLQNSTFIASTYPSFHNMAKQVTFDTVDEAKKLLDADPIKAQSSGVGVVIGMGILVLILIAVFATWIAGLVKMGMCGGVSSAYFWATLLLFLLLPGPGSLAGFIMAIVALVVLKPGKSALGITCPGKNK